MDSVLRPADRGGGCEPVPGQFAVRTAGMFPGRMTPLRGGTTLIPGRPVVPPTPSFRKRQIVLTTFGSLGDVHPYIALALGLQLRGHEAIIATSGSYRQKIEALGIGFRAVRPDTTELDANPELVRRLMDRRKGTECVIHELVMPVLRDSYEDTLAAAEGADLIVSH